MRNKILIALVVIIGIGIIISLESGNKIINNSNTPPSEVDKSTGTIIDTLNNEPVKEPVMEKPVPHETVNVNQNNEDKKLDEKRPDEKVPDINTKDNKQDTKDSNKQNIENKGNNSKDNKQDKKDNKPNDNNKKNDNKNNNKNNKDKKIVETKIISKDEAISIALKRVGKEAKLIEISSVLDDNPPRYELKISYKKFIYEIEIHGKTGAILDYEKEKIDN